MHRSEPRDSRTGDRFSASYTLGMTRVAASEAPAARAIGTASRAVDLETARWRTAGAAWASALDAAERLHGGGFGSGLASGCRALKRKVESACNGNLSPAGVDEEAVPLTRPELGAFLGGLAEQREPISSALASNTAQHARRTTARGLLPRGFAQVTVARAGALVFAASADRVVRMRALDGSMSRLTKRATELHAQQGALDAQRDRAIGRVLSAEPGSGWDELVARRDAAEARYAHVTAWVGELRDLQSDDPHGLAGVALGYGMWSFSRACDALDASLEAERQRLSTLIATLNRSCREMLDGVAAAEAARP